MKRLVAVLAAATATLALTATCAADAAQPSSTRYPPLCGTLPVYHATGHDSMATWAKAHHAFISTIILSTTDDCTHSGNPIVLKLARMMDHYVNLGNQHLNMPKGLIFTSPPRAQHAGVASVPFRTYACLAQMRTLREVSREAGLTIGSAFLGPSHYPSRPQLWHQQLDRVGLWAAGRAALRISDIATNQAFVRVMTNTAANIINGRARCTGGLPLT